MKFTGKITKILKGEFKAKDGDVIPFYTIGLIDTETETQYPNSIAIGFYGDRAHDCVEGNNLELNNEIIVAFNTNCKTKKFKDKTTGEDVEIMTTSCSGWNVTVLRRNSDPEKLLDESSVEVTNAKGKTTTVTTQAAPTSNDDDLPF